MVMQTTTNPSSSHQQHQQGEDKENESKTSSMTGVAILPNKESSSKQQCAFLLPETPRIGESATTKELSRASESIDPKPLAHLTKKYDPDDLLWVCNTRSCLNKNHPLELVQGIDGTVRVQNVDINFQLATGTENGCIVLRLQEKDVDTYKGGFHALQKVIQEELYIDLVLLKQPTSEVEQLAPASSPIGAKESRRSISNKKRSSLYQPGTGWAKISPPGLRKQPTRKGEQLAPKNRHVVGAKQDKRTRSKTKRSYIYDPGTGWVKIRPVLVTVEPDTPSHFDPFASLAGRYKHKKILYACSTRQNLKQKIPFQIMTGSDGTARIQQVDKSFQKSTGGVQLGQQVLQLQQKDIAAYQDGLKEIENVLQESLVIELIVLQSCSDVVKARSSLVVPPQKEQSSSTIFTTSEDSSAKSLDDDEKAEAGLVTVVTSTSTITAKTTELALESLSSSAMPLEPSTVESSASNKSMKKQIPPASSSRRRSWLRSKFLRPFRKRF